ncbi:MAG TPA: YoaK family protein [Sediminibacterium sp.]|nr:YoaK family protein [Sediminibacterium sp.]
MFRHYGKTRTLSHNLRIASLLSFVAGIVNVAGFFAVQRLTTNVTGHFAYMMDEMIRLHFWTGLVFLGYIFCFLLGSFVSSLLIESISRKSERGIFRIPVLAEITLLAVFGCWGGRMQLHYPDLIACSLLFAMGLQNSLVTQISGSLVRTTHLTGLFTDLGIELSQLFFYPAKTHRDRLLSSIRLRTQIIFFFFTGGVCSGVLYRQLQLKTLLIAALLLALGLVYDDLKFGWLKVKRRYRQQQ